MSGASGLDRAPLCAFHSAAMPRRAKVARGLQTSPRQDGASARYGAEASGSASPQQDSRCRAISIPKLPCHPNADHPDPLVGFPQHPAERRSFRRIQPAARPIRPRCTRHGALRGARGEPRRSSAGDLSLIVRLLLQRPPMQGSASYHRMSHTRLLAAVRYNTSAKRPERSRSHVRQLERPPLAHPAHCCRARAAHRGQHPRVRA